MHALTTYHFRLTTYHLLLTTHYSPPGKLMQKNPRDRMPASEAVHHPWIKQQSTLHQGEDAAHELQRHQDVVDSLQALRPRELPCTP